jgi:glycosyltransferase involved in cell wall biosynthesis
MTTVKDISNQITACLVVHNEEELIERCLKSISQTTNRIVVVHDGPCEDLTLTICETFGCEIHVRPFVGMCEGHRVFSFLQVNTPWILLLDADEYLSEELIQAMPDLVADSQVAAYDFYWPYWDGQCTRTSNWPIKKALFRRDKFTYLAFPHAAIHAEGVTKLLPLVVQHRPSYDNYSVEAFRAKHKKWIGIHADFFLKNWEDLPRFPPGKFGLKPNYAILRDWPRLSAPCVFIYHFAGLWCLGGRKAGRIGLRNAYFQAGYYFKLGFEIARQKRVASSSE